MSYISVLFPQCETIKGKVTSFVEVCAPVHFAFFDR